MISAPHETPATPTPLSLAAAIVPATCVPCQLLCPALGDVPGSFGFGSIPLPSRAAVGFEMKS